MNFKLLKKTGFSTKDNLICVYELDGKPFYIKKNESKNGIQRFNLPEGTYNTENNLTELNQPLKYRLPVFIIKPNKKTNYPKNFKIVFTSNPHKCSVYIKKNLIIFDESFKNYERYVLDYIKLHELGHYRFRDKGQTKYEMCCDDFALYCMLKIGYNPSQYYAAICEVLSDSEIGQLRKEHALKQVKKITRSWL